MGIRNVFKKKEPTEEELIEGLTQAGIATKSRNPTQGRQEKFGAFKQYAQYKSENQPTLKPTANPYANMNGVGGGNGNGGNPYGGPRSSNSSNSPYASNGNNSPYASSNNNNSPYASNNSNSSPYGSNNSSSPYTSNNSNNSPYTSSNITNPSSSINNNPSPYNRTSAINSRTSTRQPARSTQPRQSGSNDVESTLDLNDIPSINMYGSNKAPLAKRPVKSEADDLDLNEEPGLEGDYEDDDLYIPEEEQINSEDEEVENIKQEIRFTKQESVQSTRNTLRMAQEADTSATNTLGMLGSQSERLYNAEQNLMLIDTQNQISGGKVREIERLNRSIFIPAYGNPFNKKARLRQQEEKIKLDKEKEHYLREQARKGMYESEQRLKSGINEKSELYQSYKGEKALKDASKRYQFENDSEDDELEIELDNNLSQIEQYSKLMRSKAIKMGDEVDKQNARLKQIEEDVDKADIDVHLNTARISNIH
ncbi:hypothetical protein DFJ63DRAFT_284612 [Scheffersomyces coipomensis]|uniref:uncharacterized protein n=1 Tax=Scheffersomyces coipomensis TaxID=1788519 RepID=UPI00315CAA5C